MPKTASALCRVCNKLFSFSPSAERIFCSKKCSYSGINVRGEKALHWKGGKPRCLVCDKILASYYSKYCVNHAHEGNKNGHWKNGRFFDKSGYILILCKLHPYADNQGYIREHRLVLEKALGRYLLPEEVVHHKNYDKSDNRLENLELFASSSEHTKARHSGWGGRKWVQ